MVRLITDSAADMEAEDYEKNRITCIPISVAFGETVYYENVSLTKKEFYRLQGKEKEFPKTAQPTPQTYLDAFQEAKDAGDQVVFLSMSSKISGAYQSAVLAKDMLEYSECYVIDTCTATGGQRILLEHAVLLRDVGLKAEAIIMRRGMSYMLKKIEECPPDPAFPIHVMYTSDPEVGKQFADYLNKHQVANVALQLWQVGAAIGAHVGPGACGYAYVARK